jgi:hypothetical protein
VNRRLGHPGLGRLQLLLHGLGLFHQSAEVFHGRIPELTS